jgi:integrase
VVHRTIDPGGGDRKRNSGRRGNNEGSIVQLPNGKWRGRIMLGYLPNGKPDRRSVTCDTWKEAQRQLRALVAQKESGRLAEREKQKGSLGEYLTNWLGTIPGRVRGSTIYRYRGLLNRHVIPHLGSKKLAELKPDAIAAFYAERQKAGLSPSTVQLIHTTLRKALGDGVEYGYIAFNPVARVKPPRRADFEARVLSTEEVRRLLTSAEDAGDRLAGLWALLARTGARIGELLTLQWDAVAWDRRSIAITRSLSIDAERRTIIDAPKTTRGRRVVALDQDSMDTLRRHRARQNADKLKLGQGYDDQGLVFASRVGTPMSERNVIREFKEALERAGFSKEERQQIRIHDLRHFHITEAAHAGVSVKALSARVGHASIAFTLDRYAHAIESGDRDVADAISRRLSNPRPKNDTDEDSDEQAPTGTDPG